MSRTVFKEGDILVVVNPDELGGDFELGDLVLVWSGGGAIEFDNHHRGSTAGLYFSYPRSHFRKVGAL